MRIKRGVNAVKKRRAILKQAKGYRGAKSKLYRVAREAVMKSGQYAYVGRKLKKRDGRGDPVPGDGALFFKLSLGLCADVLEAQQLTADIDLVAMNYGQALAAGFHAVDPNTALGKNVMDAPFTLVASAQDGSYTADTGGSKTKV